MNLSNTSQQKTEKKKTKIHHQRFAHEYIKHGQNGVKAYLAIRPDAKYNSASVEATRLLRKPNVRQAIDNLMPSDVVISEQIKTAITQEPKHPITWSEKHQYINTALKLKGYMNDTNDKNVNIALVINE
ncbi:MAG: terminase small subunit [Nostocales cyanobacterium 94392]|nr:terminase small subunit [Nostocales cyanobacterium 94392]